MNDYCEWESEEINNDINCKIDIYNEDVKT